MAVNAESMTWRECRSLIYSDFEAAYGKPTNSCLRLAKAYLVSPGFRAALHYRLSHCFEARGWKLLAVLCHARNLRLCGADIGTAARFGPRLRMPHPNGIVVGEKVRGGEALCLMQGITLGGNRGKTGPDGQTQPILGDRVLVGPGAHILGPVKIGHDVTIGANAVVLQDVPDGKVAVGIPARIMEPSKPGSGDGNQTTE